MMLDINPGWGILLLLAIQIAIMAYSYGSNNQKISTLMLDSKEAAVSRKQLYQSLENIKERLATLEGKIKNV